jgi:di/tricarboxylate transporter
MPPDQIFVCLLVLVTVGMFLWGKVPPDLVAMGALFLLLVVPFNGHPVLMPPAKEEQLKVLGGIFGNNAVLIVSFMFIIGAAVERTGLVEVLGAWFERVAGAGGRRTMGVLGLLVIGMSGFLNNTTVVVVFLPILLGLCRRRRLVPSRWLIPLSYFAVAGGLCTLIGTSTNLVVSGIAERKGMEPFTMFEITPLGLMLAAGTLIFMTFAGRRLLPDRASLAMMIDSESAGEVLVTAIVSADSALTGKRLADTALVGQKKLRLIEVRRRGNRVESSLADLVFEAGDRVIFKCHISRTDTDFIEKTVQQELGLTFVQTGKAVLMEGMIGPHSSLIGRSARGVNFRQQFGVLIVAIHREGENQKENFERLRFEVGDTVLLEGSKERMMELFAGGEFINLSEVEKESGPPALAPDATPRLHRRWVAVIALLSVVILGAVEWLPFEWVALGGALLVTVGGCLKSEEIYRAVDWSIIGMILGTLGLGLALDRSGAAATIVKGLMSVIGHWDRRIILSAVLLMAIVLTEMLSNNAVGALLTPLAIQLALDLGCDPRPFVVAVMAGASIGFAIPTGYQTHMLVYSAGGYRFGDFVKVGLILDLIGWVIGSLTIPLIWSV